MKFIVLSKTPPGFLMSGKVLKDPFCFWDQFNDSGFFPFWIPTQSIRSWTLRFRNNPPYTFDKIEILPFSMKCFSKSGPGANQENLEN